MRKILFILFVCVNFGFSIEITSKCCTYFCIPVMWSDSSDPEVELRDKFEDLDDLIKEKYESSGQSNAKYKWDKIISTLDKIIAANNTRADLLKQIKAVEKMKNIDKKESSFLLEIEKQLLNNQGSILGITKDK